MHCNPIANPSLGHPSAANPLRARRSQLLQRAQRRAVHSRPPRQRRPRLRPPRPTQRRLRLVSHSLRCMWPPPLPLPLAPAQHWRCLNTVASTQGRRLGARDRRGGFSRLQLLVCCRFITAAAAAAAAATTKAIATHTDRPRPTPTHRTVGALQVCPVMAFLAGALSAAARGEGPAGRGRRLQNRRALPADHNLP